MFKRFKLHRNVTTVPVKLLKSENESLMERVEAGKRQRENEVRQLAVKRTCQALEEHDNRQAMEGRLCQTLQRDLAERRKTPRELQFERWEREDMAASKAANRHNIAARDINPLVTANGALGIVFTNAEKAASFRTAFEAHGLR